MKKPLIITLIVLLLAAIGVLVYLFLQQKQEMTEMVEQMEFEKSELEDEYEDLAMQFDGYRTPDIHNDSLAQLLNQEQQRIADSLAKAKRYNDSVNVYLRLHRKVKVSLHSAINDGHTERTAKTEMIADSLREQDIKQLTTVINQMTKEMNNERLEELKQGRFINTGKESNFIIGMSKKDD